MKKETSMLSEIGSNFWVYPRNNSIQCNIDCAIFDTTYDDIVFTGTGRGAIKTILSEIDNERQALLPSFTCEAVIRPFIECGFKISFYDINADLTIDYDSFEKAVNLEKPKVVLFHSYFGFNTLGGSDSYIDTLKREHVIVIEDITHSLYSNFGRTNASYYVGSLRKWAGLPDGGFAIKKEGVIANKPKKRDYELEAAKLKAMNAKYEYLYLSKGDKDTFLRYYAYAEEMLEQQKEVYLISESSIAEQASLDLNYLKKQRRDNYQFLLSNINNNYCMATFDHLPDNVTPLYFPIFCKGKRSDLQSLLRVNNVYAPIIWPCSDYVTMSSDNVKYLYNDLLCIPCDQRYSVDDMERIVSIINK